MNTKNKISSIILYVSLLAFVSFVVYILYINQEVFYTAHDRSEFRSPLLPYLAVETFRPDAVCRCLANPTFLPTRFRFCRAGSYLGANFLGGNQSIPVTRKCLCTDALACSLPAHLSGRSRLLDLCLNHQRLLVSQSVGYLIMLLLLWAARCTPRKWHLVWYLIGVCLYPVLGWFALLFVLCLAVAEKPTWREFLAIVLLIFTAYIWHTQYYSNLRADAVVMAGLPRFITPSDNTPHLTYPFWALGIVSVLIPLFGKNLEKWFVPALSAVAGIVFTCSLMYHDQNYIDEMRMVRYAEDDNWKEVLQIAEGNQKPTSTMLFLRNIALMNEGGLLDRSFKLGNCSYPPYNPDSVHSSLFDIASPLVYYNYGMTNEAIRLDFENAIQAGFTPFYVKMLARCGVAMGDQELVERYTTLLHHMPFYGDWQPAPVTEKIKELEKAYPDEITGVENSDSYIVNGISLWYESDSKVASEQALLYAMMRCDSRRFWAALRNYVKLHLDETFILYMDKAPEEKRMMLPVEKSVYERYKQFWATLESHAKPGMTIEEVGEMMRAEYGDTYWWYNIFGRKIPVINGNIGHEVHS